MLTEEPVFYQTVGFHFEVVFNGLGAKNDSIDGRFQSVSGLDVQIETETLKEGGENRFEHVLPVRTKYSPLTLKRGLMLPKSASLVTNWCKQAFDSFGHGYAKDYKKGQLTIQPIDLDIHLLNEEHKPLMVWKVNHAWPKSWKIGELNAEKSEVLIETIELQYNWFEFVKV